MNTEINYKTNPLNGVGLKNLLIEIVDHYGFQILFAYLNINCFKNNPSIESSVKFLKKTEWARHKVEAFYLYKFKGLPKASSEQFSLPPRDLIFPSDQTPGTPAELSLEEAGQLSEERAEKAALWDLDAGRRPGKSSNPQQSKSSSERKNIYSDKGDHELPKPARRSAKGDIDPWQNWKNKAGR
ncbi:MAG: DNA-binding protein VF530 [Gammaproteobacteria bacterium]|nr:DNA-binding protein VF530 [Gammaproteobacteria bacterium]